MGCGVWGVWCVACGVFWVFVKSSSAAPVKALSAWLAVEAGVVSALIITAHGTCGATHHSAVVVVCVCRPHTLRQLVTMGDLCAGVDVGGVASV